MQTDAHSIAHFITQVVGISGDQEPLEIEVFIRRGANPEPIADEEKPLASRTGRRGSSYVNSFTTNLSDANKQGLDNLAYWSTGPARSKTYLINQALAQYLPRHEASQRPIPLDEE